MLGQLALGARKRHALWVCSSLQRYTIMSKTTRIPGDYIIDTRHTVGITPTTGTVRILGNLTVDGTSTTINVQNLSIEDNVIVLNAGETGAGVSEGIAGVEVDRGTLPDVSLRWDEGVDQWQLTKNGTIYGNVVTTTDNFDIILDATPQLGGNLDVNGFAITSAANSNVVITAGGTGLVIIDKELSLRHLTVTPPASADVTKIYGVSPATTGDSGVYYSNSTGADELVSRKRAIVYSMIF
jgi:hypothetical protein